MRFLLSKNFMHFSMNADKQIIIYYFHFAWLNQCSLPVTATNIQKKESVIFKHIIILWKYGCFFVMQNRIRIKLNILFIPTNSMTF